MTLDETKRKHNETVVSNPAIPANKKGTFVYQKFLFCLSIAKAMAYHHALACISSPQAYIINRRLYRFRNDDIQCFALMIYRNKLRMIYKAYALIYLRKCDIIGSPKIRNLTGEYYEQFNLSENDI